MNKFNPTKAQREMIKIILSDLKKSKHYEEKEHDNKFFLNNAFGGCWLMFRLAKTVRETVTAERIDKLLDAIKYESKINFPDTEENLFRKRRVSEHNARVARNRKARGIC